MPDLPPPPAESRPWPDLSGLTAALRERWSPAAAAAGGALAVVIVVAVAVGAFRGGGGAAPPELVLPRAGSSDDPGAQSGLGGAPAQGEAEPAVVHVAGAVAHPGLYRLNGGARVADALDAAGGPTAQADLDQLNLAAKLADGERLYVPRRGESAPPALAGATGAGSAAPAPLDLNTATAEQLDALPGIGPATAAAIIAYRRQHGRFRSVDDLLEVRGIGEAKLAELRPRVRVAR